ncbi:hypothetical protein, partial [Salmonella sp. s41069]|uniref:hypothetical protein n=1 Tax=Salmonella sp. s41069 TaxID=3159645 RepID=UPI003980039D
MGTELQAAYRYIGDLAWTAEEDHYGDHSGNMDRDIHGRVYALWDLTKLMHREFSSASDASREQIIELL